MVNISLSTGDDYVQSDYVDIRALLDKIGISQDGMDGVKFADSPKSVVKKIAPYLYLGTKANPTTSPYWYDYTNTLEYSHEIENIYPNFMIAFTGNLSRQTYRTKRVIDYTFYDYYWYHDEKIPTGYAWNSVGIKSFHIVFDNNGKLLGKLRLLLDALVERLNKTGKIEKQNSGAAVITLSNGKTAFIYMKPKEVHLLWGNIGPASSIIIDKYKDVKEDMGTNEEAPTKIHWDFEPQYNDRYIDTTAVDTTVCDSIY